MSKKLNKLSGILKDCEIKGEEMATKGRRLTADGQILEDIAKTMRNSLSFYNNDPENIDTLIEDWNSVNNLAANTNALLNTNEYSAFNSAIATTFMASGTALSLEIDLAVVSNENKYRLIKTRDNLISIISRSSLFEEVKGLMIKFDLNKHYKDQKDPLEQFIIAHEAFNQPVSNENPAITSLIPIREAINSTIAALLKQRPKQEPCRNETEKILSIGKQLKHNEIEETILHTWASEWVNLNDKQLSSAKNEDLTRDEWSKRLQNATLFLKAFLSGLDPSKRR